MAAGGGGGGGGTAMAVAANIARLLAERDIKQLHSLCQDRLYVVFDARAAAAVPLTMA